VISACWVFSLTTSRGVVSFSCFLSESHDSPFVRYRWVMIQMHKRVEQNIRRIMACRHDIRTLHTALADPLRIQEGILNLE